MRPVGYSTFTGLWRQLLPYIVVMKPMTDLCWLCQQNGAALAKCSKSSIEEKTMVCILNACMNACMCGGCECVRMDV